MEIIQEIGSYAGFAAVVGLAVLSALYFSQARDVKRLREWAGRAPERVDTPLPGRVVAQPVPKPPVPKPPTPAKPGVATPAAATPAAAAAAAAGAAPAVATGPAAPAETEQEEDEADEAEGSSNGTDEHAVISQDTEIHPPPVPPGADDGDDEEGDDGEDDDGIDDAEGDEALDEDPDREPDPEDFHEDFDPDSEEFDEVEDTGDEPALAAPPAPPLPPSRPTIPIGGASTRSEATGILPPYEESRPGGASRAKGGGVFSSTGRAVAVVGGSLLALLAIGFGVLQLTGDDDEPASSGSQSSSQSGGAEEPKDEDTPAKKKTPGINPGDVRVAVLNGTTVPGLAAQIGDSIERQGFQLGTVTNFIDQQRAESVVKYAPGAEREAADVGKRLKISQREPIDAESQGLAGDATVVVVAGADKTQ